MASSFDALFAKQSADVPTTQATPASAASSFDELFANPGPAGNATAPTVEAAAPESASAGSSFDAIFAKPAQPSASAPAPATQSATGSSFDSLFKREAINPLVSLSDEERRQSNRPDPENQVEEPWYSKTWDWLNKPLYDAHQWGTRTGAGTIERGVESGVEDLISNMSSPLSVGLLVGTLGGDSLLDLGAAGLRSLGVSREAAPFVAKGVKSLIDLGFTGQQVIGLLTQSPKVLDALKDGDYETAARLGTNVLAAGTMAALGARKTFEDAGVVKDAISGKTASQVKTVKKIAGRLDEANAVAGERAKALATSIRQDLKSANATDEITQGAIRKYIAADGDTNLLRDQHDALAGTLPVKQQADVVTSEPNPNVKDFGRKANLDAFVQQNGGVEQANEALRKAGFDAIRYTDEASKTPTTSLIRDAADVPKKNIWSQDYVYRAVDPNLGPMVRNSGLKSGSFFDTPEQAIESAALPPSGKKADLEVFGVPRNETETNANTKTKLMPSHQVVVDQGPPTGQVVSLRPDSSSNLTTDKTRFESEYTPADKEKLLAQYQKAQELTPDQIAVANRLREFYANEFDRANQAGIIRQAVEGYHPQAWAKDRPGFFQNLFGQSVEPSNNAAFNYLRNQTDNGAFDTNVAAARHRAFETEFQGEMAGYKAKSNDLAYHAANYQNHLDRSIAARQFLDGIRASGARAFDGRPLVALQGSSKVVGQESGNPALLVNPQTPTGLAISNDAIKAMMSRGELQDALDSGKIDRLPFERDINGEDGEMTKIPAYAWNTEGYQTIDHPSMRDWQHIGKDTAGNDALLKANMRVHPEVADYVRQVVGADPSAFRTNPYLRTLMAAQREAKGTLLSFSPFHAVQEGLRGAMMALGSIGNKDAMAPWMDWSPAHIADDPLLRLGVRNNLTFPDYRAEDMFSDGLSTHSKLIGKIPVANKIQNFIQEFTFDKLIPGLKARAFKSVYYRFLDAMPEVSADEVAHQAATYVNDVFGGQHWRDLGFSTNAQDIMRIAALAPDWLTSEARMLYRAAGGLGSPAASIARSDMLRLTAGLYMTARVINMLSTGKAHPEAPFGIVVPGKNGEDEKVYSMRTLPTDLIHALSDPRGFIMGRVNPLTVRTTIEGLTGRNDLGQKVNASQEFGDAIQNIVPIGVQGLLRGSNADVTNADQLVKAGGGTVYKYRTEAENLAQRKASDHMPSGTVDPDELAHHQRNIKLEDGLRSGDISSGTIRRLLPAREADEIVQNSRLTPLQSRFVRLPLKDALDVWALATPTEKDNLHTLLWNKRLAYIQTHTPAQRRGDPTWRKMQSVYSDLTGRR